MNRLRSEIRSSPNTLMQIPLRATASMIQPHGTRAPLEITNLPRQQFSVVVTVIDGTTVTQLAGVGVPLTASSSSGSGSGTSTTTALVSASTTSTVTDTGTTSTGTKTIASSTTTAAAAAATSTPHTNGSTSFITSSSSSISPTTSTAALEQASPTSPSKSLSNGAIAGIATSLFILGIIISVLVVLLLRRRRRHTYPDFPVGSAPEPGVGPKSWRTSGSGGGRKSSMLEKLWAWRGSRTLTPVGHSGVMERSEGKEEDNGTISDRTAELQGSGAWCAELPSSDTLGTAGNRRSRGRAELDGRSRAELDAVDTRAQVRE